MTTNIIKPATKASIEVLTAIARYRHQRRSGRVWLIGDRRVSAAKVASLERGALLREIALNGRPALVLTDQGRQLISGA